VQQVGSYRGLSGGNLLSVSLSGYDPLLPFPLGMVLAAAQKKK
jgi:hypothetical protein